MGFKISWIGFQGLTKGDVLDLISGTDSGIADEANDAPFSIADIPGGWIVLFSNDFEFVSEQKLEAMSSGGLVVACQVHEGVMVSAAYCYDRGKQLWAIAHNAQNDIRDLTISGEPPSSFEEARKRLSTEQENCSGEDVDYFFDIPLETAQAICPYKHDLGEFEWGEPHFTVVNVTAPPVKRRRWFS